MSWRFSFEVAGVKEFDRAFNRVGEHISDLRPVWDKIERTFYKIEREQFDSEGSHGRTGKWAAITRPYAKRKAQKYGVQPILRASGKMAKSLTGNTSDTVLIKEKDEFGIGTRLFYAAFHQTGTNKMPARPPISFSDDDRRTLQKEMQKGLLEIIRGDRQITRVLDVE
jgi:phage gpG-like protein